MKSVNQEHVLSLIQKEAWRLALDFFHKHKREILNDQLLKYSVSIFESEFFKKISDKNTNITLDNLRDLYLLHKDKIFTLEENNYKKLVCELALQSTGEASYNYANLFPEEIICKQIIKKSSEEKSTFNIPNIKIEKMNWIEIYNRLFEVINVQEDAGTYFSGPRFIKTLKKFKPYYPDYSQYIGLRNEQGKSTSRKIFYYDIIMELDENTRINFVNSILKMIEPFEKEKVISIKALIKGEPLKIQKPKQKNAVIVFISYSWDTEDHKKWVLDLADNLCKDGIDVLLDRYELRAGKSVQYFVENSIKKANKILIVFTPNYKLKAEKRVGGVGYEYSILNSELYQKQADNERIIPILRTGKKSESIPEFMQQYIHIDMANNKNYKDSYTDLLRELYDKPEIVKPKIGAN